MASGTARHSTGGSPWPSLVGCGRHCSNPLDCATFGFMTRAHCGDPIGDLGSSHPSGRGTAETVSSEPDDAVLAGGARNLRHSWSRPLRGSVAPPSTRTTGHGGTPPPDPGGPLVVAASLAKRRTARMAKAPLACANNGAASGTRTPDLPTTRANCLCSMVFTTGHPGEGFTSPGAPMFTHVRLCCCQRCCH